MQHGTGLIPISEVRHLGAGPHEGLGRLRGAGGAAGHQYRQAGAMGRGQAVGGILDRQHLSRSQLQLAKGETVGLGVGLLGGHILPAHPQLQLPLLLGQQLLQQGCHRRPAAGGHDHLGHPGFGRCRHQPRHAWPEPQLTGGHQPPVVTLLGGLQGLQPLRGCRPAIHLRQEMAQSFPATADPQQLEVALPIPHPGQAGLLEGAVEGAAMAIQLRLREGAIHIPEQGRRKCCHRTRSSVWRLGGNPQGGQRRRSLATGRSTPHNGNPADWCLCSSPCLSNAGSCRPR